MLEFIYTTVLYLHLLLAIYCNGSVYKTNKTPLVVIKSSDQIPVEEGFTNATNSTVVTVKGSFYKTNITALVGTKSGGQIPVEEGFTNATNSTVVTVKGIDSYVCGIHVFLKWTVSENLLTLKCRVNTLLFRVSFTEPSNNVVGECLSYQQHSSCNTYANHVYMNQNTTTNETICLIQGVVDQKLNGRWTCQHGTNMGQDAVEVSVLRYKDEKCRAKYWSIIGYFGVIILWLVFGVGCPLKCRIIEDLCKTRFCQNKRAVSAGRGALFSVLTFIFVIIVWKTEDSTDINCKTQYYVLCFLAPIFGLIIAVVCINSEVFSYVPEAVRLCPDDNDD